MSLKALSCHGTEDLLGVKYPGACLEGLLQKGMGAMRLIGRPSC